jgi:ribosomal protein L6P/L9E
MQSIILPTDVSIEISTPVQGYSFLKRKGSLGTFIKKRGDFKLTILEKNQNFEGARIFVSGASPQLESIVLAQLSKQAMGLSLGSRKRLRLVGIGFRGIIQKRPISSLQAVSINPAVSSKTQNSPTKAIVYPKYRQRSLRKEVNNTAEVNTALEKELSVLQLKLGYSHDTGYPLFRAKKKKVQVAISRVDGRTKGTVIVLSGSESPIVSEIAVQIQNLRKPDIYKGKGIHSEGTVLVLKKGKRQG